MSLPGSTLFTSVSSGRRYLNPPSPPNPAHVSAWNLQLSINSQILPHLEVAAWGGLETVEVLGEGWKQQSFWILGGFCAEFCGLFPLAFLDYEPKGSVLTIGFGWKKRVFNMLKWCANVWHLPLKSVAAVAKVMLINDCEIRVLLISVADELKEELVECSKLEELIECCPDFGYGLSWMYCVWKRSYIRKSKDSSCAWQCLIWDHSCLEKCFSFFSHRELQLKLCCCSPFF